MAKISGGIFNYGFCEYIIPLYAHVPLFLHLLMLTRDITSTWPIVCPSVVALHSHSSEPLPPAAQVIGLVPRAALPMVAADNADAIRRAARDVEHQLQVDAAQNPDKPQANLDDLPNEGILRYTKIILRVY